MFRFSGDPVISVDTTKKELVGAFQNKGRTWRPQGQTCEVNVYDFPSQAEGNLIPLGHLPPSSKPTDVLQNRAVVNVGTSHDISEFAVETKTELKALSGRRG